MQGTFGVKPEVSLPLKSLLSRSHIGVSLAPSDHGKQSLRLQVFLKESALQDCASGKLLPSLCRSGPRERLLWWQVVPESRYGISGASPSAHVLAGCIG